MATEAFYQRHMIGNEWRDSGWPTRQWLVPACEVNKLIRREVPLVEVLKLRLANKSTEHHAFYTAEVMRRQIANEMDGDIQARWNAALDAAALKVLS